VLRPWKAGDRVRLRHSSGPRKVKEVLERLHISGSSREDWPVLEYDGRIVWMRGVEVERESGVCVEASTIQASAPAGSA
jgi:tRNA(Ile)-lysidine synthase